LWDVVVGMKMEGATLEHQMGEVAHDRFGLEMEVAEHFIGAPTAQKANDVTVYVAA